MILTTHCLKPTRRSLSAVLVVFVCLQGGGANNPPRVTNFRSSIIVREDTPVGTAIMTLTATDADGPLPLTFDTASPETAYLVSVTPARSAGPQARQADVILKVALDSDFEPVKKLLQFKVSDGQIEESVAVSLYITDVNDNRPQFQNLPGLTAVDETTGVGTSVFRVKATDPDRGFGGVVSFVLQNDYSKTFSLDQYSGTVTLLKPLDYETLNLYLLNISVTDGGGLSSQGDLRVVVGDVQDTPPSFLQHAYTPHVAEHSPPGTTVVKVTAFDGDVGHPNPIQYQLTHDSCGNLFAVDRGTGTVRVGGALDSETGPVRRENGICLLSITALEVPLHLPQMGSSTSWVTVVVNVDDVNDHKPVFSSSSVTAWSTRNVPDYTPIGFLSPFTLTVSDKDQGEYGLLELSIKTLGALYDVFDVLPKEVHSQAQVFVRVINASALKSFPHSQISIQVTAREKNTPDHFSSMATIEVKSENSSCVSP